MVVLVILKVNCVFFLFTMCFFPHYCTHLALALITPNVKLSREVNVITSWLGPWLSLLQLADARPVSWLLPTVFIGDHKLERSQSEQV